MPEAYGLYLYPDEILVWFYLFASITSIAATLVHPVFFPVFLFVYFVLYWLVYHFYRLKCFPHLISALPVSMEEWILGYVERFDIAPGDVELLKTSRLPADMRLRTMLTRNGKVRRSLRMPLAKSAVARLHTHHPQEWLLRAAIASFIQERSDSSPSIAIRILSFWGAPVWAGYVALFVPLLVLFYCPESGWVNVPGLVVCLLVWGCLSIFFAFDQTRLLTPGVVSRPLAREELDGLPIELQPLLVPRWEAIPERAKYDRFKKYFNSWAAVINAAAFGVYALLLTIAVSLSSSWL